MSELNRSTDPSRIKEVELFNKLYAQHAKELIDLAFKHTGDRELSKDITQEIFLDYWKRRKLITIKHSLRYFLRRAVVNQSIHEFKKRIRLIRIDDQTEFIGNELSPLSKLELNEIEARLIEIIHEMPKRRKEVFLLSKIKQLSHHEISMQLNISKKTIENHVTMGMKFIRLRFKEKSE